MSPLSHSPKKVLIMKKILLSFLLLASFNPLFADYLFQPLNVCVKDFWFVQSTGEFKMILSHNNSSYGNSTKNYGDDFFPGYEYNATTGRCQKVAPNNTLGMDNYDFNYLNAVIGVVVAILFVWGLL